ncbi:ABC transporter ATP-binding protein [Roseisolibacter sp. H3M3-2]|uniref:ABC transporter ATP-binding protein n=1 Tax=Roseisolibacter sp. H3M3-2 TaxID=3031323 RepID=UPI0023DCB700|nr:ABC transporter ATP-binding protein [Roseisolibacter sp. H3M3-2]MDF1502138.1 ABC transporter ATP-binding protein [Roseisolibacter sp. H3M3-2]
MPYRTRLGVGLALVVTSAALGSVVPWLLRSAIDALREGAPAVRLWQLAGAMIALSLVGGVGRFWMREIMNGISREVETDLRDAVFGHLLTLDAAALAPWRTGELMARLTNDLSAVRMAAGPAIMYLTNTVAGGAFALAFMLRIDARLTGLALLPMALLPVVMIRLGRLVHDRFEAVQSHFGAMTTRVQENLSGTRVVRAYRQEAAEEARFAEANAEYVARNMALARLNGIMNPSFGLLAGLGGVVVLGLGGALVLRGAITVGAFVAFGLYLGMLTWPMIALGWVTNLFQRGAASMARIVEVLDTRASVVDAPAPAALPPLPEGRTGRRLEFRDVGFHFPPTPGTEPRWALRHVSFVLEPGDTLGVVGAVGSGKTALLELVPRLWDPQEGEILLDGAPLRALPIDALRRAIGFVPQESLLFSDTVGANIAYGMDGAREEPAAVTLAEEATSGVSDPDPVVRWAADVAQLAETVDGFPSGYGTMLGERGVNLSGGQKQRAAIARALARRPGVVLLDDALSAVDTQTEAAILQALRTALAGRTTIIASHRISAVRDATAILVLDGGRVVERGRHDELVALGGRYAAIVRRQRLEADVEAAEAAEDTAELAHGGGRGAVAAPGDNQ